MITYILFILGFAILIKGADLLVSGASAIAKQLKVSEMVIGLTIVSIGTSAPEMFVNIIASTKGTTDLAIGNIVGSNIANILLVLGVTAAICPVKIAWGTIRKDIPFSLGSAIILGLLANNIIIGNKDSADIGMFDGIFLLLLFALFLYYQFKTSRQDSAPEVNYAIPRTSILKSILLIVSGLLGMTLGSDWIVDGAIKIAQILGISEKTIGLTIVAFGTSLPELAASAAAAFKKNVDLAVGNVIGSNIFNILLILGISSVIRPIPYNSGMNIDLGMMLAAHIFILAFIITGKRLTIDRWEGSTMTMVYLGYIGYLYLFNG